ncbi:ABC transporter ATP-binding protein [Nanoarchaeota archaeon]
MGKSTIIELRDVTKQFRRKVVLDRVNFKIMEGDIFGVIGLSGCGKTTLLSVMVGFIDPEEGEVLFRAKEMIDKFSEDGLKSVKHNLNEVKKTFGFAAQTPSFYPRLTVVENLIHFGSLYGLSSHVLKSNIDQLLVLTGLEESKHTLSHDLSGGMQKRLDIACAMIHAPNVLILDEPTADLDPISRRQLWNLIRSINKRGTTILMSSHFLTEIELLCDNIAILHDTAILESGAPDQLKHLYTKNEEIELESRPGDYGYILKKLNSSTSVKIEKSIVKNKRLIIYTPTAEKALHHILHIMESRREKLVDINVNKPSLSEIFESLVVDKKIKL